MKQDSQLLTRPAWMSKRNLLIAGAVGIGLLILINIFALLIYVPRLSRRTGVTAVATPPPSATPVAQNSPAAAAHVPLAAGATVQREERSMSGNIRLKYVRSKGNPLRQIVLESTDHPGESKVFFEYQRNAWILVSPNDEWIALNNRPNAGHSEVFLYHHDGPGALDYAVSEETKDPGTQLHEVVWNYYLQELGLPLNTSSDGVAIDAVGWDADSRKLTFTVTVSQADPDDNVPPPWNCVLDLDSKQLEVTADATTAFNTQQQQVAPGQPSNVTDAMVQATSSSPAGELPGEKYPDTRTRVLTDDDISDLSASDARYAIAEIYARHGADFADDETNQKRFSKLTWYKPRPGVSKDQVKTELSDVEKKNLDFLDKRVRHLGSSRSKSPPPAKPLEAIKRFFKGGH